MDPVTAFAAAQAAVAGIKAAVNLYKDARGVSKDISGIAGEIASGLGKFFEAQEAVCKAGVDIQGKLIKTKSVDAQALDNVMRVRQLQQYEQELKELLIYHTPMAGVWEDFQAERQRLRNQRAEEERAERARIARAARLKKEFWEDVKIYGLLGGFVVFCFGLMTWFFAWLIDNR